MPYIKEEDRYFDEGRNTYGLSRQDIGKALGNGARNAGDFNYMISTAIAVYLKNNGLNYANCNEIVGMLECCKQEFIRRVVNPYEDAKLKENGDCGYHKLVGNPGELVVRKFNKYNY